MNLIRNKKWGIILGIALIFIAIGLSLFRHWEMSGESWVYWFFARIFKETGKFIVIDRSPLYVLYLNAFQWMGYPYSVIAELIVTSLITTVSFVILFKRYLGLLPAIFAALAWLPYLQAAEPPVQMLALACSCWGVVARLEHKSSGKIISYAFFMLAYLFRSSYFIMIIVFGAWDAFRLLKGYGMKNIMNLYRNRYSFLPLIIVIGLFIWFVSMQSPHPLNNVAITSTIWFPYNANSLRDGAFIQNYNWKYIEYKYGTFKGRDFYFTNQELFGGARTAVGAILNNPKFVIEQIGRNIKDAALIISSLTILGFIRSLFGGLPLAGYYSILGAIIGVAGGIIILYGSLRAAKDESMKLFIISNILLIGVATVFLPKPRYMVPLVPLLVLSAYWHGIKLNIILLKFLQNAKVLQKIFLQSIGKIIPLLIILLLSNGIMNWSYIVIDVVKDLEQGKVRLLESNQDSMKSSFNKFGPLIKNCNGLMLLEDKFIGAFFNVPVDRIYDIWEIPPFGHFGDQIYNGLRIERVNCIFVSDVLATQVGKGSNAQLRYENYILPYIKYLEERGAITSDIEGYGYVTLIPKSKKEIYAG